MLENLRKQGASLFIWVIFAILIAVFVINFGPQSPGGGQGGGCTGGGKRTILTVGDSKVDDVGFRFAVSLIPGDSDADRAAIAFESLIMRELLAQEAGRRGLRVPDGYVDHVIADGKLHFAGALLQQGTTWIDYRGAFYNEDGVFDYNQFKRWTQARNLSVAMYKRQQAREIMASSMAFILMNSVPASREEAQASYILNNTLVSFEAVRFDPRRYGAALLVTDEDVDRWAAAHEAEVKAMYSPDVFKGKKQIRVRRISLAKSAGLETEPPSPTPATPGAPAPAAPTPPPADPAKAKLEALRASILAGKTTFVAATKANDREKSVAARGGDLGWFDTDAPTLPEQAMNDAIKTLEKGKISEVITAEDGFYILTVDDKREGDLTFDQVKRELAEPLAREAWGQEAARRAAILAITAVKASGGKNLKDLFTTDKMGATSFESEDVPVAWLQGDSPSPTPAAPTPAAGAETPAAPTPAAPKQDIMVPTTEKLPELALLEQPSLESFGPISRAGNRTPLGESPELARALFEELTTGSVGQAIYEVRPSVMSPPLYVIAQVTEKQLADITKFEKDVDTYVAALARERGGRYLVDWLRERCTSLAEKKEISFLRDAVQQYDEQGKKLPLTYAPCMSFNVLE
jgi:hypothetical protein